jgi:hypothetical protein
MNCCTQKAFNADEAGFMVRVVVSLAAQADEVIAGWPLVQITGALPCALSALRIAN